ncbi:pentatricopeptide repeat-containing protein At5g39710 [Mercurialis annua]|uniref:pentatricopeptide repeat-containing protein At5g39710 n=1 Tax=Mercurialis annua TaxID=3986 RepID=UPI00215F788E|nr:pentatricopeptide repeat-containing protein At5g39710 [Mercurialis annua]XP_050213958.1 pentatricopeptide repeat-containing protein At5g39710 [Mercurialis annua]
MNLKQLVSRKSVNTLSRCSARLLSLCPNYSYRDFSTVDHRVLLQSPKSLKHGVSFKRFLHSAQQPRKLTELNFNPKFNSNDSEEVDRNMSEFLSRFVYVMRGKLSDAYRDFDKQAIEGMLLIIVEKVVAEMEKGSIQQMVGASGAALSQDFSDDLWRTVWEVSNSVLEDMEKERKKQKMKQFLQDEEVKEMCRFSGEIGIRGDLLRELRFKWAREKMEESEFYAGLEKLREEEKALDKEETDAESTDPMGEEKPNITALPKRHGKIKYKIYGLDLSNPKWVEVANKIHETGEILWPQEAKPIQGKCKLVTKKILSLKEEDDPSQLLAEWVELLQPNRIDWMTLLDRLEKQSSQLYLKVAESLLSEKSFQPNVRDYSILIDAYAKENRLEDAERILKKMIENGIVPDILTCTVLLHMYSKAGNFDRAKEAFESLRSHGFQPDMKVYSSMIMACVNAGHPRLGESLVREMEARGIKPTEEIYMALLRSFSKHGDISSCNQIVNAIQMAGFQRGLESYTLLIEAHAKSGDTDDARMIFDDIIKIRNLRPDDRCTAAMIAAYERENLLEMAVDLLLQLEKDGYQPGLATYTILVDWLGKLQLVDEAEEVLGKIAEQGETPSFKIQVSLCDMYARAGNERKARQALGALEAKKEQLGSDDFERIINALVSGGFVQEARKLHELMESQGYTASEGLKVALMASQTFSRKKPTK